MTRFAAALAAICILGGLALPFLYRGTPPGGTPPRSRLMNRGRRAMSGQGRFSRQTKILALSGLVAGLLVWILTGWAIAALVLPLAAAGLPLLLMTSETGPIARAEAMEEWTRSLAGVLTVGVGLEQAIVATLRSTPDAIRPEVTTLVSRLRARWTTDAALRAFADDLDDATGDLIASSLLLGSSRRGAGLSSVLDGLAATVAEDVRIRRSIEADRAKPRSNARAITLITLGVLVLLFFNDDYVAPYRTGLGQVLLAGLLLLYAATLVWMRQMAKGTPLPRFLGTKLAGGSRTSVVSQP